MKREGCFGYVEDQSEFWNCVGVVSCLDWFKMEEANEVCWRLFDCEVSWWINWCKLKMNDHGIWISYKVVIFTDAKLLLKGNMKVQKWKFMDMLNFGGRIFWWFFSNINVSFFPSLFCELRVCIYRMRLMKIGWELRSNLWEFQGAKFVREREVRKPCELFLSLAIFRMNHRPLIVWVEWLRLIW